MEENKTSIESLFQKVQNYLTTNIELFELKLMNKSVKILSDVISYFIIFLLLLIIALMFSIGAAFWLGDYFGKNYYGFLAIGVLYIFVIIIVYLFRHQCIYKPISKNMTAQFLNNKNID